MALVRSALTVVLLAVTGSLSAQELPAGPVRALDGRLLVGGEIVATVGSKDDEAYYNHTDYDHNALRMFRVALSGEWRVAERVTLVGELRSENVDTPTAHAAYIRIRPWTRRRFDIQAGRIPPTFGAFGRRAYSAHTGPIGYPLAYQYLTSLRPEAVPARPDDLLAMRGSGWRAYYPVGIKEPGPGVPLVSAFRWDTGVQAHWASDRATITGAVTKGTLSSPRVRDDNDGLQLSMRATVRPLFGLIVGGSAARGSWLARDVERTLPEIRQQKTYAQTALGADAEYSRDHWVIRAETVWSRWVLPMTAFSSTTDLPISAMGTFVEGQYRFTPRVFAAARIDTLRFSSIAGILSSGQPTPWEAPVRRFELAAGYHLQRNLVARVAIQRNRREHTYAHQRTLLAAQLAYWF